MAGSLQHVAIASGVEWAESVHQSITSFFFNSGVDRVLSIGGQPTTFRGTNYSSNYTNGSSTNLWNVEENQIPFDAVDIRDSGFDLVSIYVTDVDTEEQLASIDDFLVVHPNAKFLLKDFVTYDTDYSVATGGSNRTAKIADFVAIVAAFKSRPEVVGFAFANENNLAANREDGTSEADWYSLVDAALEAGKAEDDSGLGRFYATIDADLGTYPGDDALPNLDVLGLNIYRGTTFTDLGDDIAAATSKPTFLSEFGRQRDDNTNQEQQDQADEVVDLIKEAEGLYPYISFWVHFKFTHIRTTQTGDDLWESAAPLAEGTNQTRDKYLLYGAIKDFLTENEYGAG